MVEFETYREFEQGLAHADLEAAVERCGEAIQELRSGGETIAYLGSEVFLNDDGAIVGTMCCFEAESRDTVREANDRAEVPFEQIYRRGTPVEGERPKSQ